MPLRSPVIFTDPARAGGRIHAAQVGQPELTPVNPRCFHVPGAARAQFTRIGDGTVGSCGKYTEATASAEEGEEKEAMKYFTPERYAALQDLSSDEAMNAADRAWDEQVERYRAYLDSVRAHFPPGLRQIEESYYLHDAIIHGMGKRGQTFVIILQLDTPPQSILTFAYNLVEDPIIIKDALPPQLCGSGSEVDWQYEEIEMIPGAPPTWKLSVLLGNGWELSLHFRDVQVQEVEAVLPIPRTGVPPGVSFVLQHTSPG
jgi:hypothetical protein